MPDRANPKPKRVSIPPATQAAVLLKSARRCCLCYHLFQNFEVRKGQIAHLDDDPSNPAEDNLAFLCFDHHDEYDAIPRLSKGFTILEAKTTRTALQAEVHRRKLVPITPHYALDYDSPGFTGRTPQIAWLTSHLYESTAIALLHGDPGAGKSTLAIRFGHHIRANFDAVIQIACGDRPLSEIGPQLSTKIPAVDPSAAPEVQLEQTHRWLASRHSLLILDDVWRDDLRALLPGPPVSVLLTSRKHTLFGLPTQQILHLGGFTEPEALDYLSAQLPAYFPTHRDSLANFAQRVQHLPYPIAVAAGILRNSTLPRAQAIAALAIENLTEFASLLQQAVANQSAEAQQLLRAFSICSPEGAPLSFAAQLAGLSLQAAQQAAASLYEVCLLHIADQDAQTFSLHATLHEFLSHGPESDALRSRHYQILTALFANWEEDRFNALALISEALRALEHSGWSDDHDALANNSSECAYRMGRLPEAVNLLKRAEQSAAEHKVILARLYGNQALILRDWGRLDEAIELLKKQEAICAELGDRAGLQRSWGNQALILKAWGRLDEAMELHKRKETVCAELGDRAGLQRSWGNQALILQDWGRLDEAMELLKKQESVCVELGDRAGLARSWGNQALILKAWGRLDEAMETHQKEEAFCAELGDRAGLQRSWGNQAVILQDWGRRDEAIELLKKQEALCAELGDRAGLAMSLGNQSLIHEKRNQLLEARAKSEQSLAIFIALGMPRERDIAQRNLDRLHRNHPPPTPSA